MSRDLDERLRAAAALELDALDVLDALDDLVDLGCELAEVGRLSDAETCFRKGSDLGSATASFNLGNCLAKQRQPPRPLQPWGWPRARTPTQPTRRSLTDSPSST